MSATKTDTCITDVYISRYKYFGDTKSTDKMTVRELLDGVVLGTWREYALQVRSLEDDPQEQDRVKKQGTGSTPNGLFRERNKDNCITPSGFQVHDLDHLDGDKESVKNLMAADPYVYAVWDSVRGKGLCLLIRIDNDRFDEAFIGFQDYLTKKYGLFSKFDPSGKDISRFRFDSWDPEAREKTEPTPIFKEYPPKKKPKERPVAQTFIHTQEDFDFVFRQIIDTGVDITPHYQQRLSVCFALVSKFGDSGWPYFDRICQNHIEYDERKTERMWKSAMGYGARRVTIATFYHYAKEAGLDISRPFTREVTSIAAAQKKQGGTINGTVDTLKKMKDFDPAETEPIVRQVYECREEFKTDETEFGQLDMFFRTHYNLRYNEITHYLEDNGVSIPDRKLNLLYINAVDTLGIKMSKENVFTFLLSEKIPSYNPIKEFFAQHKDRKPTGLIKALAATIDTDSGLEGDSFFPDYAELIIRKWLIGIISAIYGEHCPLVLVLTGKKGTGKTEWFRRLLPEDLQPYFAETTWPVKTDTDIMMCENLIAFNDEWRGETVKNPETLKGFASTNRFTLREPYGRSQVKRRRLAVMCGTSNPTQIIKDPDNNRKIVGINVKSMIDIKAYNAIDKVDLLMEAYHAYMAGERHHLTVQQIERITSDVKGFENHSFERLLLEKFVGKPTGNGGEVVLYKSAFDIMIDLEPKANNRKLSEATVGSELQKLGYEKQRKRIQGERKWGYEVIYL